MAFNKPEADPLIDQYNRNNNPTAADTVNYAPAVAGVSAAGAARPDVFDVSKIIGAPPPNPFAIDPKSFDTSASLAQKASERTSDGYRNHQAIRDYKNALAQSKAYYELAHEVASNHHEATRNIAAGNILSGISDISPHDQDYEQKVSAAIKDNIEGVDHPAVQDILSIKHAARQAQLNALAQGGGGEFEENSPGAQAYATGFHSSGGDAAYATARGKAAEAGHKTMTGLVEQNALTPSDFPHWEPGQPMPTITGPDGKTQIHPYNSDHTINYSALNDLGASRVGARADKENRRMNADERTLREQAGYYQKALGQMDPSDPSYEQTKQVADDVHAKLLALDAGRLAPPGKKVVAARKKTKSTADLTSGF